MRSATGPGLAGLHADRASFSPDRIRDTFGFALFQAQEGKRHIDAKPMRGFGDASVLEVVEDHVGDTYRCIYTVRFAEAVHVLHVFKKKSKRGIKTPKTDVNLIRKRLRTAEEHHARWKKDEEKG